MTLTELLAPFGVTQDDYLNQFASALSSGPIAGSAGLNVHDRSVLERYGGVTLPDEWTTQDTARSWVSNTTDNLARQVRDSLTVEAVATLLGIAPSRVRHRVNEHGLYAFKIGNRLRLPTWQFHKDRPLPGLALVLVALRDDLHPLEIAGFMNTPDDDLQADDRTLSPREWLLSGGDPAVVVTLAKQVDTIW